VTISESVYKWRTFVPVRFRRARTGAPHEDFPDLDDRGYRDNEHGPMVGITADDVVRVQVRRVTLDPSADLFVTTTETGVVTVVNPRDGHLPAGERVTIHLRGHRAPGRTPNVRFAKIQVRFGSASGPVLGELSVRVFRAKDLDVTPHVVTIRGAGGERTSIVDVGAVMSMARAIWKPCGIRWTPGATRPEDVRFATAGVVMDEPWSRRTQFENTELARLLATRAVPDTINIYFVHRIGTEDTLGYGFPADEIAGYHVPNPGIVVADTDVSGFVRDVQSWAGTVAHEVGHFLGLEHAGNMQGDDALRDQWAHRMLMWNNAFITGTRFPNVGYGHERRGTMITMKHVPGVALDSECGSARNAADAGPYGTIT